MHVRFSVQDKRRTGVWRSLGHWEWLVCLFQSGRGRRRSRSSVLYLSPHKLQPLTEEAGAKNISRKNYSF